MKRAVITSREAVFASCRDIAEDIIGWVTRRYGAACATAAADEHDLESDIWFRLWSWLQDDRHLEQMEALLEDESQARAFLTQFAKARACDHINVYLAGNRDSRLTLHASYQEGGSPSGRMNGSHADIHLDRLAHTAGFSVPPEDGSLIEEIRAALTADAETLFDFLLKTPEELRKRWCDARMIVKRGVATLTEAEAPHEPSTVHLDVLEGSRVAEYHISWDGPLPRRGGIIDTDHGPARFSFHNRRAECVIRWPEQRIVVRLELPSNEGEFSREIVRPSPAVFDIKAAADMLGLSNQRVRFAWRSLQGVLKDAIGYQVRDIA